MKKAFLAFYIIGMIISYGHIYKEFSTQMINICPDPAAKKVVCFDTLVFDNPRLASLTATIFWPYHWSAYFWGVK